MFVTAMVQGLTRVYDNTANIAVDKEVAVVEGNAEAKGFDEKTLNGAVGINASFYRVQNVERGF